VASVSHEFRTPLTSLRQFTDLLANTMTDPGGAGPNGMRATRFDVVRISVGTGDTQLVFPAAPTFRLASCTDLTVANSAPIAIRVRNLNTGAETELYRFKRPANRIAKISPDGRLVAFLDTIDPDTSALMAVPSTGGPARRAGTRENAG